MNRKVFFWNVEFNLVVFFIKKMYFSYYLILIESIDLFDIIWYLSVKDSNFFDF